MGTTSSRTRMKGVFVLVALSVAGAIALETELDPAIPRDKCGVTVGINEDDRAELFILGADKSFYHKFEQDKDAADSWSSWIPMGGSFKGGPTVVRSNDGRLEDQVHVQPCGDLVFRGLHSLVRQGC